MKFFTSPLVLAFWRQKLLARKSRPGGNAGKKLPATRGSRTMPYSVRKEEEKTRDGLLKMQQHEDQQDERRMMLEQCDELEQVR